MSVPTLALGQAGFRFEFGATVVYIDPYLSHSVERMDGERFRRQIPIPMPPGSVADADLVLISHGHADHCDPDTLPELATASPACRFLAPNELRSELLPYGIEAERIVAPREDWIDAGPGLRVRPVPAAHPRVERDSEGHLRFLGFLLDWQGRRFYHAGDTSPCELLIDSLRAELPIHVALLPVNEHNFFRERLGIIGNMTVREAFALAEEIGVETLVPIHWDMFGPNSVYPEEISLLYDELKPKFELRFGPVEI